MVLFIIVDITVIIVMRPGTRKEKNKNQIMKYGNNIAHADVTYSRLVACADLAAHL